MKSGHECGWIRRGIASGCAASTLVFGAAVSGASARDGCFSADQAAASAREILDRALRQPDIVNSTMLGQSPSDGFFWAGAGGIADPETGERMTPESQFRIASITKMMTAAVVLQLTEEGFFSLDTDLGHLLDATDMPPGYGVADLSVIGSRRVGESIEVRQLLNHTAGLRDYVFDSATGVGFAADSLAAAEISDVLGIDPTGISHTQWSSQRILAWYFDHGLGANALAPPGARYHYSDTGYVLLGIVIEEMTGSDLATQFRQRVFAPLGMTHSYLEWYEPARGADPAHHFVDLRRFGFPINLDVVAAGVNTSFDWAGGGVVSTADDLNRFLQALFDGKLFRQASTLTAMLPGGESRAQRALRTRRRGEPRGTRMVSRTQRDVGCRSRAGGPRRNDHRGRSRSVAAGCQHGHVPRRHGSSGGCGATRRLPTRRSTGRSDALATDSKVSVTFLGLALFLRSDAARAESDLEHQALAVVEHGRELEVSAERLDVAA